MNSERIPSASRTIAPTGGRARPPSHVELLSDPEALRGSLGWYGDLEATIAQNDKRASRKLTMPVLAIGGERSYGDHVAGAMGQLADDITSAVITGAGHWVAEEAPDQMLAAMTAFLAPYRNAG